MWKAIHRSLKSPIVYTFGQWVLGFAGVRRAIVREYVEIGGKFRVLDIGCGPGNILRYFPTDVDYVGFDVDQTYIDYANNKFGDRAQFHCRIFDGDAATEFGPADLVVFNGVLHHLNDQEVVEVLKSAQAALHPGGRVMTLDGCIVQGRSRIEQWLMKNDRGEFIRTEPEYKQLMTSVFPDYKTHLRQDLGRMPYTYLIMIGCRPIA